MNIISMPLMEFNNAGAGVYYQVAPEEGGGISNTAYAFPISVPKAIGVVITGDALLELTLGTMEEVINNAAVWIAWDGKSIINPAVQAWRMNVTTGTASIAVTVRTDLVGA